MLRLHILLFPLGPQLKKFLHGIELSPFQHPINVLIPLRIGFRSGQSSCIAGEPAGKLVAYGIEKTFNRFIPCLIWKGTPNLLYPNGLVKSNCLSVKVKLNLTFFPVLSSHCFCSVVLTIINMQHLRHSTDLAVDHLYQAVFQGLAISINRNDIPDDRTAPHILPGSQLWTYCLYLSIGGSVLYPNIKGMLISYYILHHLKGSRVPFSFEHHFIFPFPCSIGRQVLGASGSPLFHQVAYVTPDRPHRRTLPPLPFCFRFQCIIQHFPCPQILTEGSAEPHRRNIRFLFLRK